MINKYNVSFSSCYLQQHISSIVPSKQHMYNIFERSMNIDKHIVFFLELDKHHTEQLLLVNKKQQRQRSFNTVK